MTTTAKPRTAGAARTRVEGREKVTGTARYASEQHFEELAHGWLVLSTVARGRVRAVDEEAVRDLPGVLTVLHSGNAPRLTTDFVSLLGPPDPVVALFQHDRVPHLGWPVALVVAETPEQAREAAEALVVEYDEEPHDVAFHADRPGSYTPEDGGAVAAKGDLEAELAASGVLVDASYTTPEQHHSAMEPHAATARWDEGRLEVLDTNQGTGWVAGDLAQLFSLDASSVRVRSEHIGGAFGSKGVRPHQVGAVMAATVLHRPVRLALTRRQVFAVTGYRSPTAQRVRLGADPDGRLRAFGHEALNLTSTLRPFVETSAAFGRIMYDARAHHTAHRLVGLDMPTPTWMRAPARRGAGILRGGVGARRTGRAAGHGPDRTAGPQRAGDRTALRSPLQQPQPARLLRGGRSPVRLGRPRPAAAAAPRGGRWLLGTGTAAASYPSGAAPSTASVTAEPDGGFTVRISAADVGTAPARPSPSSPRKRSRWRPSGSPYGSGTATSARHGSPAAPWAPGRGPWPSSRQPRSCAAGWHCPAATSRRGASPRARTPRGCSPSSPRRNGIPSGRSSPRWPST